MHELLIELLKCDFSWRNTIIVTFLRQKSIEIIILYGHQFSVELATVVDGSVGFYDKQGDLLRHAHPK